MTRRIAFLGTSKSGLGHLRRICNIARCLQTIGSDVDACLITNAVPKGLNAADLGGFRDVSICERREMASVLSRGGFDMAVADTLKLPGSAAFTGRSVLILREMPDQRVAGFRRDDGRAWDRLIVPNPASHWLPAVGPDFARSVDATGWIVRPTGARRPEDLTAGLVIATGGGGTPETRALLYPMLEAVIAGARTRARSPVIVRQALGPRASGSALAEADEVFDPGGDLNAVFRAADLVVSTAGYNSVLELASTDTPALLAAIPRSLDDQAARVQRWGPKVGFGLTPDRTEEAAAWLADQIDRPRRRAPVDLGPDGATKAAKLLLDALCPVS